MKYTKSGFLIAIIIVGVFLANAQQNKSVQYKNPALPIEKRAKDLINRKP